MKILLSSHFFHPSVGGIEQVSYTLAHEFVKAGHELKVVTSTPAGNEEVEFPFEVTRRPNPMETAARWWAGAICFFTTTSACKRPGPFSWCAGLG